MKKLLHILAFILLISCSDSKGVYWCGDHPCINKKEKESYFKKNMIVEKRDIESMTKEKKSDLEKIMDQAKIKEKKRIIDEKELKMKKTISKQKKKLEKQKIKEKKRLSKKKIIDEKLAKNQEESLVKAIEIKESQNKAIKISSENKINETEFNTLAKKIIEMNRNKPFPDINN